jgi:predicted pyridoxine 5'-phosphate oxidase superfamily flavin-nucleotide-binding protein
MTSSTDIAFSPAVKSVQERRGSRDIYARLEANGGWATRIEPEMEHFIAKMRSCYLATASKDGQPYIQHRGGLPGFLHVLDDSTLAFADFRGNRQYITTGNLAENPRAMIFLMDYERRRRVKIWGRARVVENAPEMIETLVPDGYRARAEAAILFKLEAIDVNCPQHIPQMLFVEDVAVAIEVQEARVAALEAENERLRSESSEP